jgi:hypothetical protein
MSNTGSRVRPYLVLIALDVAHHNLTCAKKIRTFRSNALLQPNGALANIFTKGFLIQSKLQSSTCYSPLKVTRSISCQQFKETGI